MYGWNNLDGAEPSDSTTVASILPVALSPDGTLSTTMLNEDRLRLGRSLWMRSRRRQLLSLPNLEFQA